MLHSIELTNVHDIVLILEHGSWRGGEEGRGGEGGEGREGRRRRGREGGGGGGGVMTLMYAIQNRPVEVDYKGMCVIFIQYMS